MPERDRLRGLVDAGIALSSELSLDDLLQKLAETAADLTGARYAALGVINETGTGLERFLHTGIDAETVARIGELPRGSDILGALITDARSLRLESINDDPRSPSRPIIRRCADSSACRSCCAGECSGTATGPRRRQVRPRPQIKNLRISTRAELVRYALEQGSLEADGD
jgi:hypothetical protein